MIERQRPNAGYAVGYHHTGQAAAEIERIVPNIGDAVGDCWARQTVAKGERSIANASDAVCNNDVGKTDAVEK
jgi:hypothetical protein